jgi:hypothetical protein
LSSANLKASYFYPLIIFCYIIIFTSNAFARWSQPANITPGVPFTEERMATSGSFIYAVGQTPGESISIIKSSDNGVTWSPPVTPAPIDTFYASEMPDIIYSNGKIHIAWVGYFNSLERQKIFHISSSDGGNTWSVPHRIFNNTSSLLKYPRLAAKGDTLFLTCRNASASESYLLVFRSFNGGVTWRDSTVAEPIAWNTDYHPTILYSQGKVHLVYQIGLDADSAIEIIYRSSANFGTTWSDRVHLSLVDHHHGQFPSAYTDGAGKILVAWFDYAYGSYCGTTGDILTRVSTDNGGSWLPIGRATFTQSGCQTACAITGSTLHVVWNDNWLFGCAYPKLMHSSSSDWGLSWSNPELVTEPQSNIEESVGLTSTIVGADTTLNAFVIRPDTIGGGLVYIRSQHSEGIGDDGGEIALPEKLSLEAYPNPFNSAVIIAFKNPGGGDVEIGIFDISGRKINSFTLKGKSEGKISWDACDAMGNKVSSGIYFAKAGASQTQISIKLIYLK